jgi:ABC-type enterobactin transport system permease subunit
MAREPARTRWAERHHVLAAVVLMIAVGAYTYHLFNGALAPVAAFTVASGGIYLMLWWISDRRTEHS